MSPPRDDCRALSRRGSIMVLAAAFLVVAFAFAAFSVDFGFITLVKAQLQAAADAAALGSINEMHNGTKAVRRSALEVCAENKAAGDSVVLSKSDIELGTFDVTSRSFMKGTKSPNAVKVTTRVTDHPLFFGPVLNHDKFSLSASAIAMLHPRDIVFVVDLSGSMNDDTEPAWATRLIDEKFAPEGYAKVGTSLMQDVFTDFSYGSYPGKSEFIGAPLGVAEDEIAFAEMTKDDGPLACPTMPDRYRVEVADDEHTRKKKGYLWIMDNQIDRLMPGVIPPPKDENYLYWSKYLDYIITSRFVGQDPGSSGEGGGGGGGPTPTTGNIVPVAGDLAAPVADITPCGAVAHSNGLPRRGGSEWVFVPPNPSYRLWSFNNPNPSLFPGASADLDDAYNMVGFRTYVQFMMDLGRDRGASSWGDAQEFVGEKSPLSIHNPNMPVHWEKTAGGAFQFPPREQPMHAVRRSLIAALEIVRKQNVSIPSGAADRVSIVTYDFKNSTPGPQLIVPLTNNYQKAMQSCAMLQPVNDRGYSTATEPGLILAREHLALPDDGGQGRPFTRKVIVLLSDGVPNAWASTEADISSDMGKYPSPDYYPSNIPWCNAALVQSAGFQHEQHGFLYPVGMGLGADLDFMDRMARLAKTDNAGASPRGTGNPVDYEQRLTEIFKKIIQAPGARLVK